MISVPRIPQVEPNQRLDFGLVNHIIKRTEYAAGLLRQYKCIAGDNIFIEQNLDRTRINAGVGNMFIGIAGSTGGLRSILAFNSFIVNSAVPVLDAPLGTAVDFGGGSYRLTNDGQNQVGAVWKTSRINASSFSASFFYSIGGFSSADGITLIFSSSKFLVGTGGGNGYQGGPATSVAIEIDIFLNPEFDPNNSHIAVLSNGDVTKHLAISSPTVRPSGTLACSYSGGKLNITHNGIRIISYSIDIPQIVLA